MLKLRLMQAATVLAFAACAFFAIRLLDRPAAVSQPKIPADARGVAEAIGVGQEKELAVTGYLFDGGGWNVRLCTGKRRGSPPRCVGPFLYVEQLPPGSFNMKSAKTDAGRVQWVDEPVTLLGRIRGTDITVSQVLATPK